MTPIRAVLDDLPPSVRTDVLFRSPKMSALILRAELDQIAATRSNVRVRYLVGNRRDYPIDARTLLQLVPDIQVADLYVCGPEDFIAAVREAAHVLGIPGHRIHHEAFSFQSPDTYAVGSGRGVR